MRNFLSALLIVGIFLIGSVVHAEVKTYTGVGEYYMSDYETPDVAKQRAKQRAEQNACEQAGVYVKAFSRTKDFELVDDEVITMTSGILKVLDVQYYREHGDNDTTLFRVTIQAQIDSDDVLKWLNKDGEEKSKLVAQMEALRKSNEELAKQNEELKKQIANVKTEQDKERITQEFAAEDKIFLSNQKLEEGLRFRESGNYDDAIKVLTEALELNPSNEDAKSWLDSILFKRGRLYIATKQYEKAVQDFDTLIEHGFYYEDDDPYMSRAMAYAGSKQYEQAIQDLEKSIELCDDYGAHLVRGAVYFVLKQYELAIQDLDQSINQFGYHIDYNIEYRPESKYDFVALYMIRGLCYQQLGDETKAQADFAKIREVDAEGKEVRKLVELIYEQLGDNNKTRALLDRAKKLGLNC